MYCPNCGKDNPTGTPACHFCGAPLTGAVQPKSKSSATTIIVVVVVVCFVGLFVVALLGAILFPVFARAREAARKTNCQTNMKELAMAAQFYSNDYDGRLPQADRWCDLLQPRLKSPQAFVCPNVSELRCGYGLNSTLSSIKNLQAPDAVVLFFESDRDWNAGGGPEAMVTQPRHGAYNIAFADGHVRLLYQTEFSTVKWSGP